MANHALPTTSSLYTDVLTNLKDRIDDSLKMLDSVNTSPTSVPTNSIRWNSTTNIWEKYNGSSWVALTATYSIETLKSINLVGGNSTTLLGSIAYQSNTDTTTLLAPNTTTTRKFLRQTGTGTNGAAPVWDTILASDVPTLNQNTTGNAVTATKLQTARTINGVSFDGSASINIEDRLGTAIASSSTTSLGSSSSGDTIHITGTTTITSFGSSVTGVKKTLIFDAALTLTHNATSLILPASLNVATAAGDSAEFVCENGASGYWRCLRYTKASISIAELGYLDGVTSAIQTQINGKAATSHTHTSANIIDLGTTITAAITAQKASSTVYGTAKIYLSGSDLYIVTT